MINKKKFISTFYLYYLFLFYLLFLSLLFKYSYDLTNCVIKIKKDSFYINFINTQKIQSDYIYKII